MPYLPPPPLSPERPAPDPHTIETLRGLAARLGPWQRVVAPASGYLVLAAAVTLAEVIAPMLLDQIIDDLILGDGAEFPWLLFGAYAIALFATVVFDQCGDVIEASVAGSLMAQVHVRLLSDCLLSQREKIVRLPAQPTLFERSVAQNLWLDDHSARMIPDALRSLWAFVDQLPVGHAGGQTGPQAVGGPAITVGGSAGADGSAHLACGR